MTPQLLIAGAGIGGLAAALACSQHQAGRNATAIRAQLFERTPEFEDAGAGIQLGPNATRRLQAWGLGPALSDLAAFPPHLRVCSAHSGKELARLTLGQHMMQRYGAPYATLHRADLQGALLQAVQAADHVQLHKGCAVTGFKTVPDAVAVQFAPLKGRDAISCAGHALVAADGLWSGVRQQCLGDGPAPATGHLAWRALVPQAGLPAALRSTAISVWLGRQLHVVAYPVRRGESLNVVVILHAKALPGLAALSAEATRQRWSHDASAQALQAALPRICPALQDLLQALPQWRLWVLCERPVLRGPQEMADVSWAGGRVALLGDAAHPMRPYLAQGAAMALEDAHELAVQLQPVNPLHWPQALQAYAQARWQRNARVQARAARNGRIFHASGWQRLGRDIGLQWLGPRLLDQAWLYAY